MGLPNAPIVIRRLFSVSAEMPTLCRQPIAGEFHGMPTIQRAFARLFLISTVGLLLVPGASYFFTGYVESNLAQELWTAFDANIDRDSSMSAQEKSEAKTRVHTITVADICGGGNPKLEPLRNQVCAPGSE